jgi:simple sugar transport system ATP-binding protein
VGRIPEDRHRTGTIADFSLTENAVLEGYAGPGIAKAGFLDWGAAEGFARRIIEGYDVRCPGPGVRVRLLSGGNMQKLILGRVLEARPRVLVANQPVQGLDVGAIAYVHGRLVAARDGGAAVLLISEDLDEVLGLSDVIHVISGGRLSPPFARGAVTQAELGLWMAGQGFEGSHAA